MAFTEFGRGNKRLAFLWTQTAVAESTTGVQSINDFDNRLEFDCVVTESHEADALLTEHPVEVGAAGSDHKIPGNRRIRLDCAVSNTPLGKENNSTGLGAVPPGQTRPSAAAAAGLVSNVLGIGSGQSPIINAALVYQYALPVERMQNVYQILDDLRKNFQLMRVQTNLTTYENVQLIAVTAPRTAQDGDSITFALELVEQRIVETSTVDAPQARVSRNPRGRPEKNKGTKQPDQNNSRANSNLDLLQEEGKLLEQATEFLGGLL